MTANSKNFRQYDVLWRLIAALLALAVMYLVYRQLNGTGVLEMIGNSDRLRQEVIALGYLSGLAVVGLMATAVVINPVPSAPIALAAGAVFGHTWGTIYVVIGAAMGAVVAFSIARTLGYQVLERFLGQRFKRYGEINQNRLMIMVFISRLIPFISFDLVSYAAGLTALSYGRFAIATLIGLVPTSFLLTHFGSELAATELNQALVALVMLGVVALIPLFLKAIRHRRKRHRRESVPNRAISPSGN